MPGRQIEMEWREDNSFARSICSRSPQKSGRIPTSSGRKLMNGLGELWDRSVEIAIAAASPVTSANDPKINSA